MANKNLKYRIVQYSIDNNVRHIPSALSCVDYLYELFSTKCIIPYEWNIVIGKPFGAQTYYTIWDELFNLNSLDKKLSYGVNHEEIEFVDYSEVTLGNALGIASGISYNGKKTWCNISDGALQMGPTLEAIQFIGHNKQNILLTIDYNNHQLTGSTNRVLGTNLKMIDQYFMGCGWSTYIIYSWEFKGEDIKKILERETGPIVLIIKTVKGDGVIEMEDDPTTWHYKQLEDINEITFR